MKKILLPFLAALAVLSTEAQNQFYKFTQFSSTYTELVNPVVIDTMNFAEGDFYLLPLTGETFSFFGVPFPLGGIKTFHLQPNGNLRIDNDSSLVIIDGAFTWLDSIDATSSVSYLIEGTAGNRVVKVQWKNLHVRVGDPGNYMNLQIWVYQSSGAVEIHYGPSDSSNRSGFGTGDGPQVGMFFARDDFSKQFEKLWVGGSPSNVKLDSGRNFIFNAMSGIPEGGRVFRFEPKLLSGMNDVNGTALTLYPNPAGKHIRLQGVEKGELFQVYDLNGKKVFEEQVQNSEPVLDIARLAPGAYGWVLVNKSGKRHGKLLITE